MPRRVVEAVNRRGIKVRGQWVDFSEGYEGLPAEKIEVGQEYEVKFVKDEEGKWWVRCVEPVEEADSAEERERRIARMNALTNAVNFAVSKGIEDEEEVLKIADRFYRYIIQSP